MSVEIKPSFGNPLDSSVITISSFPDAKLKQRPFSGWLKDKTGKKFAVVGVYNGSVNPDHSLIVSQERWNEVQGELRCVNVDDFKGIDLNNWKKARRKLDSGPLPKFVLPAWAVIEVTEEDFGVNQGELPSKGVVFQRLDLSSSGKLQIPLKLDD